MIALLILFLLINAPLATARDLAPTALEHVIGLIESQRNLWTAVRATMDVKFSANQGNEARCLGKMTYHRLDEKLLFQCFNDEEEILFSFKTDDRLFEIYLPGRNAIYSGNIFTLEDSDDLDSQIKPLSLYRALKPMAISPYESMIETQTEDETVIQVLGNPNLKPFMARRVYVSDKGYVTKENYYSKKGEVLMSVMRDDFKNHSIHDSRDDTRVIFPKTIKLETENETQTMFLEFKKIKFYSLLEDQDWSLGAPPQTPLIILNDKIESEYSSD